ncbi:MAG TPA: hypothetical protein VG843_02365 [Rhizomicrobium sp.]|jgi:hypothetical protein|nr:hypothetical protein [Rhizomicrobium sp.]
MQAATDTEDDVERARETNSPFEAPESAALRKRIIKLRWIGREEEAERLCAHCGDRARDAVWAGEPAQTD